MTPDAKDPLDDENNPMWDRLALIYAYVTEFDDDQDSDGFMERFEAWRQSFRDKRVGEGQ